MAAQAQGLFERVESHGNSRQKRHPWREGATLLPAAASGPRAPRHFSLRPLPLTITPSTLNTH
jgi:hypothetical protein